MTTWPVRSTPAALPTGSAVWRGRIRCGMPYFCCQYGAGDRPGSGCVFGSDAAAFLCPFICQIACSAVSGSAGGRAPAAVSSSRSCCLRWRSLCSRRASGFYPGACRVWRVMRRPLRWCWSGRSAACCAAPAITAPPPAAPGAAPKMRQGRPRRAIKHKAPRPGLAQDPGGAFAHICCFPSVSAPGPAASHKAPGRFWLTAAPGSRPPWPHSRRGCTLPA